MTEPIGRHVAQSTGWRASRLRQLGYGSYREYLRGDHWKQTRARYWSDPDTIKECVCGEQRRLALHHLTYVRLGRERLEDLRPLCHQCHNDIHVLAQRSLIRFDLADYDDVRRRLIYALERRRQLEHAGTAPDEIPDRPYDPHAWAADARVRAYSARHELRADDDRREQARRIIARRRAS